LSFGFVLDQWERGDQLSDIYIYIFPLPLSLSSWYLYSSSWYITL